MKLRSEARVVLDASAIMALHLHERGATAVRRALARGAVSSAVNVAEVLTKSAAADGNPEKDLRDLLGVGLRAVEFTLEDATVCAALRRETRERGLSLGDRACLALGRRLQLPVLTADRAWAELDVGVDIRLIR